MTAVCPGPVNTEFFQIAEQYGSTLEIKKLTMITSEQCVSEALYASYRKKDMVIPGIPMKAFAMLTKIVPQGLILKIAKMMKNNSGETTTCISKECLPRMRSRGRETI